MAIKLNVSASIIIVRTLVAYRCMYIAGAMGGCRHVWNMCIPLNQIIYFT